LSDLERQRRLDESDKRATVETYVCRAKSALYGENQELLSPMAALVRAAKLRMGAFTRWRQALQGLDEERIQEIVERMPSRRMSQVAKVFSGQILRYNRFRILELKP
jgi:hypothetical protein